MRNCERELCAFRAGAISEHLEKQGPRPGVASCSRRYQLYTLSVDTDIFPLSPLVNIPPSPMLHAARIQSSGWQSALVLGVFAAVFLIGRQKLIAVAPDWS